MPFSYAKGVTNWSIAYDCSTVRDTTHEVHRVYKLGLLLGEFIRNQSRSKILILYRRVPQFLVMGSGVSTVYAHLILGLDYVLSTRMTIR